MAESILFLTGKLAEGNLTRVLEAMQPTPFTPRIHQLGINVAGLMTADMIRRRLPRPVNADRVIVPGRCRGDLQMLCEHYGIPVQRGPDELKDLPQFFGQGELKADLSRYDINIFAEIVDAPELDVETIFERARRYRLAGADVIDIGCLPDTPFPHLAETVNSLVSAGFRVSVDSVDPQELLTGGLAGADYLLSLNTDTLWLADEVESVPVLIPSVAGDLDSLIRAMEQLDARGRRYLADPILDPLLHGFTESIHRYRELRRRRPDSEILMGIGNVTELTDADTGGINAVLAGIATELGISHVLTTSVSCHAKRAVNEADAARRVMHCAHEANSLPRDIDGSLMSLHERRPFPYSRKEIEETASAVRDPSYRIQISDEGIHIYNRDGLHSGGDPFGLFQHLDVDGDTGHAFYLGAELARAQIAWQLGKRYVQDQELGWGCACEQTEQDSADYTELRTTLARTGK